MQPSTNLAARAGRWSARHRKTAIFGWLAFVIVAFVIGGAVGQKSIADEDYGNGSSKVADQAIANADFRDSSDEQVLVQGKGSVKVGDPAFTAAVDDVVTRLEGVKHLDKVESPLAKGNEGQLSEDGRSALVTFEVLGDDDTVTDRVKPTLAATAAAQKANPDVFVGQFGDASAPRRPSRRRSRTTSRRPSSSPSPSRFSSSSSPSARSWPPASRSCSASPP